MGRRLLGCRPMKWVVIILIVVVVGAVGAYWYEGYRAESALLDQPVYRVLKKHEPVVYEKLVAEYKTYQREETSRENFINFANSEINLAATQSLAHASEGAVLALVKDMLSTGRSAEKPNRTPRRVPKGGHEHASHRRPCLVGVRGGGRGLRPARQQWRTRAAR